MPCRYDYESWARSAPVGSAVRYIAIPPWWPDLWDTSPVGMIRTKEADHSWWGLNSTGQRKNLSSYSVKQGLLAGWLEVVS